MHLIFKYNRRTINIKGKNDYKNTTYRILQTIKEYFFRNILMYVKYLVLENETWSI